MDRASSGELDMLGKRKAPPAATAAAGAPTAAPLPAAGAPARTHQRAPSGPASSSPALWRSSAGAHGSFCAAGDDDCQTTGESARAKTVRVCAAAAADAAAPGAAAAAAPAGGETQPLACHGSTGGMHMRSLPNGSLYHSFHAGCCSRLSSSSSLAELEAAACAAAADAHASSDDSWAPQQLQQQSQQPADAAHAAPQQQQQQQQPSLWQRQQHWQRCGEWCEDASAPAAAASYWADVPDDILKRVLERLAPSSLRVLRLVCRGWEAAASRLLRHLRPEAIACKQLGRRFPALHSLDLSNCCMGVDFAGPRMLRLQSLLEDGHLVELAGLHRLEQLSLRGCSRLSGRGLAHLGALRGSLTMLNLSNCAGLSDECLGALAAAVPQLATLNLQGCSRLGDDGVAHLATMPTLRHVLLPSGVTDAAMHMLTEMPALERVALRGCGRVTTAGVYVLLQHRGLKRVVLSKCALVSLESLCSETHLKVVTEPGVSAATAADAALADVPLPLGGLAGQDMQLLVADAPQ